MANYPQYNYQPQQMGYQPQMQPMYQQYQQPAQQAPAIQCRYVSSEEEARASQVDFNGTPLFFYDPFRQIVYYKAFNAQAGAIDFFTFKKWQEPQHDPVLMLEERIRRLEEQYQTIAKPMEVNANEL